MPYILSLFLWIVPVFAQDLAFTADTGWLPVTEQERAMKAPMVDRNAGAEAIFNRTHVWDELASQDWQRFYSHYIRIKVFNEKGIDQVSNVDITTYRKDTAVIAVSARTIKPDGTIVEMPKDAVKDRQILKAGGISVRAKSFTLPAVEPGSIVEYRYREVAFRENILYLRGHFQREIPVQKSTFFIRPLPNDFIALRMMVRPFNCSPSRLKLESNGFHSTTLENVPAFQGEPYMPGEANVRPWVLFFYTDGEGRREPDKYWSKEGKDAFNGLRLSLKLNNEIKAAAAKAVSGASSDEQKVVALITYLRTNLRDLFSSKVTDAERGKVLRSMPKNRHRTSVEVFESGIGTPNELNTLFAAMAQSAGLEARPARVGNSSDMYFHPNLVDIHFLDSIDMAVKIGGQWKLYDVSTRELPPHMIGWREEGTKALVSDSKSPQFIDTPPSPPSASLSARTGKFRLDEDGALEGDVQLRYTGHRASDRRSGKIDEPLEKLIESHKESLQKLYPGAEISAVAIENMADSSKDLVYSYHVRIPGYSQRTGKRLFFQPLFFQRSATPLFTAGERQYDIQFPYAWQEDDTISIRLPEGYAFDNAENPGGMKFGRPGEYQLSMTVGADRELKVSRRLIFGLDGSIFYPKTAYTQLKQVFDEVHRRDSTTIALKQVEQ